MTLDRLPLAAHLAALVALTPGVVRTGATWFDNEILLPLRPLDIERVYGDPRLLRALGELGSIAMISLGAEVAVGAETAGVPLAASVAREGGHDFAYVRKSGYRGHVEDEPAVRGAPVDGRRVALIDDAIWRGLSLRSFVESIEAAGGEVAGAFCVVDMRQLAPDMWSTDWFGRPVLSCASYFSILDHALDGGLLSPRVHELILTSIHEAWAPDDSRWNDLRPAGSG